MSTYEHFVGDGAPDVPPYSLYKSDVFTLPFNQLTGILFELLFRDVEGAVPYGYLKFIGSR